MSFPRFAAEGGGRCLAAGLGLVSAVADALIDWISYRVQNNHVEP